jgi:hypothetical protein
VEGKYDPRTLEKRFGGWPSVRRAFCNFAKGKQEWADVVAPVPLSKLKEKAAAKENSRCSISPDKAQRAQLKDRPTYGNPIDFRGLRHEPVNEQGVVLRSTRSDDFERTGLSRKHVLESLRAVTDSA